MLANPIDPPVARDAGDGEGGLAARGRRDAAHARARGRRTLAAPLTISGVSPQLGKRARGDRQEVRPAGHRRARRAARQLPGAGAAARRGRRRSATRAATCGSARSAPSPTRTPAACGRSATRFEAAGARNLLLQDAYVFRVVNDPNAAFTGGSYKLAVAGHDVGTLSNDAFAAVVGTRRRAAARPRWCRRSAPTTTRACRRRSRPTWPTRPTSTTRPASRRSAPSRPLAIAQAAGGTMQQRARPPDRPHVPADHVRASARSARRGSATATCRRRSSTRSSARSATRSPSTRRWTPRARSA